jgi:hypothetical protein
MNDRQGWHLNVLKWFDSTAEGGKPPLSAMRRWAPPPANYPGLPEGSTIKESLKVQGGRSER